MKKSGFVCEDVGDGSTYRRVQTSPLCGGCVFFLLSSPPTSIRVFVLFIFQMKKQQQPQQQPGRGAAVTACWRRHISLIFPSLTGRSRPRNNNNTNTQSDGMYLQRRPVCRTPSVNAASGGGEEEEEEEEREGLFGGFGG